MDSNINDNLRVVTVSSNYPYLSKIRDIYEEAFPPNERIGTINISNYTKDNGYYFFSIEDDKEVVGFALLRDCGDDMYFLIDYAIGRDFRNKKYGSRFMNLLLNEYFKDKALFACIEALLPEADNYEQRVLRRDFYVRNGWFFRDKIIDAGYMGKYQVVYTKMDMDFVKLTSKLRMMYPDVKTTK